MKFTGDIANTELSKLLEKLASNDYAGTLTVAEGESRKTFYFEGSKNMISEIALHHQMKLGDLLISYGKITQEHIDYVVGQQSQNKKFSGQLLIDLAYCTQADIDDALRAQIQMELLEVIGWEGAEFEFTEEIAFPQSVSKEQGSLTSVLLNIPAMFEVLTQRIQEWTAITPIIPTLKALLKLDKKEAITEEMRQGNTKKILQLCDGRNRIIDIVHLLKMSRFDVCTIFCSMIDAQVLRQATFDEVLGVIKVFESTKRNEKAVAFLEYASQLDPGNTEIVEKLAHNFEEAKDTKKAAKYYAEFAKIRKKELNLPEFDQHIRKAISLDKKEPSYRQILIQHFLERELLEEAAETARQLAALYFEMEANDAAENLCELFFDKDQYSVEFRKMLINHYLRLKDKNKASAQYEKLVELAKEDKQKIEYYLKILSVDPSRNDIRKKMNSLGMKQLLNTYKWLILGTLATLVALVSTFFYLRSSAHNEFEGILAFSKSGNLGGIDICIQKLNPLKNSWWIKSSVEEKLLELELLKTQIEEKISYNSYQSEITALRKLLEFPLSPKTMVTEKMIIEKLTPLELLVLEEVEKQAGKLQQELKERIGAGEELEKGKNRMTRAVWQVYQNEVDSYYKVAYAEKFGRLNKGKKETLEIGERFLFDAEKTSTPPITPANKIKCKEFHGEIPEIRRKLQEELAKCNAQDPFQKRYEDTLKKLDDVEKLLLEAAIVGGIQQLEKLLSEAALWADPDGGADLKQAIKIYQTFMKELFSVKNLDERARKTFQDRAQTALDSCEKILSQLQSDTTLYQESLKKNTEKMNEVELQEAYNNLTRLLKTPWSNYWQEQLKQENKSLLAFHWIETSPPHAFIYVNENLIGRAPRFHRFALNENPVYRAQVEGFVPSSTFISEDKPWLIKFNLDKLPLWTYNTSKKCDVTPAIIQDQYFLIPQAPEILTLELSNNLINKPTPFGNKKILENIASFGAPVLVLDDKFVFVITNAGMLYKMDRTSSVIDSLQILDKSKKSIKIQHSNTMAVFDKFLYIACTKGIVVIDISTKKMKLHDFWSTPTDFNGISTGLLIHKSRLFFGCEDQSFYMFQLADKGLEIGTKKTFLAKQPIWARLSSYENYIVGTSKKYIYGFDLDLNKIWESNIDEEGDGSIFRGAPVIATDPDENTVGRVFAVNEDGEFYCLKLKSGELLWKGSFINTASGKGVKNDPLLVGTTVYYAFEDGKIVAKNLLDEQAEPPLFKYENYEGFTLAPLHIPSKKLILFLDINKRITAFEQ